MAPVNKILLQSFVSFIFLVGMLVVLLIWGIDRSIGLILPPVICMGLSAFFSWAWGMGRIVTAFLSRLAFFIYFGFVSLALLINSSLEWLPIVETAAVLIAAYIGTFVRIGRAGRALDADAELGAS
jgi:ribose/xylose/arabinose/galactoside ABC-type transport system permease subunit